MREVSAYPRAPNVVLFRRAKFLLEALFQYVIKEIIPLETKQRVNDLVSRLTTEEIMYQMAKEGGGKYGGPAHAITRLGIKFSGHVTP